MYCKKVTKSGGIHRLKHLAGIKGDIGPCRSVTLDVKYQMENSLQEVVKSKKKHLKRIMSLKIHMVPMCHNLKGMSDKVKKWFNKCKILQYHK